MCVRLSRQPPSSRALSRGGAGHDKPIRAESHKKRFCARSCCKRERGVRYVHPPPQKKKGKKKNGHRGPQPSARCSTWILTQTVSPLSSVSPAVGPGQAFPSSRHRGRCPPPALTVLHRFLAEEPMRARVSEPEPSSDRAHGCSVMLLRAWYISGCSSSSSSSRTMKVFCVPPVVPNQLVNHTERDEAAGTSPQCSSARRND